MARSTRQAEATDENTENVDTTEVTTNETTTNSKLPKRNVSTGGIPGKVGRPRNDYSEWSGEVDDLRNNLGQAFSYEGTENAPGKANGLKKTYGIHAAVRDLNPKTKVGVLWIEYPSKHENPDDETSQLVPDEDAVQAIKERYARQGQ